MTDIKGRESPEMYLKMVYLITKEKNYCRHVDLSNRLGVSKSSVSVSVSNLRKEGFLSIDEAGMIFLTDKGLKRAQIVYEKFCFWESALEKYGLDPQMAAREACKVEHALSDEAFLKIKERDF